jgi:Cu-processing system permease protein
MILNSIFSIAKKEILDNVRNKWIIILTIIFASLTLVVSYFGSIFSQGWQNFGTTISGMMSLVQFLIPIIGLMLGYAAIIGEIEKGSMSSLLSLPVNRLEIILGKFFGLGSMLSFTTLIGFGVAGIVIAANVADVNYADYLIFIGATVLLGLVFLSLALFFSSLFKKRSTAMGGAILLWFLFNMILPLVFVGIMVASSGIENILSSGGFPDWYHALELFNPLSVYSALISLTVGPVSTMPGAFSMSYPSFYSSGLMASILILWIVSFLLLAFWRFDRRDV